MYRGKDVLLTREPGGNPSCEFVRDLLLHHTWEPTTEAFLFNASRHEHCKKVIEPALKEGKIVVCDRFMDSTIAYQGYGLGISLAFLKALQDYAVTRLPTRTFIFDLDPTIAQERLQKRLNNNSIDARSLSFHQRVREGFLAIARENTERCIVLDACEEQEKLHERLRSHIIL